MWSLLVYPAVKGAQSQSYTAHSGQYLLFLSPLHPHLFHLVLHLFTPQSRALIDAVFLFPLFGEESKNAGVNW